MKQESLFPEIRTRTGPLSPDGLHYRPDFISNNQEEEIAQEQKQNG